MEDLSFSQLFRLNLTAGGLFKRTYEGSGMLRKDEIPHLSEGPIYAWQAWGMA